MSVVQWVSGTAYTVGNEAYYNDAVYLALNNVTSTTAPNLDPTNWRPIFVAGPPGPQGPAGPVGPTGPTGGINPTDGTASTPSLRTLGTGAQQAAAGNDARLRPAGNTAGVFVPDGWGSFWRTARDSAGSSLASVAIVGDSVGRGMFASNLDTASWAGRVRTALQASYGDGGMGWKGATDSTVWHTAKSVPSAATAAYVTAGNLFTLTGTWTATNTPGGPAGNNTIISTSGSNATLTYSVRGTTIRIYTVASGSNSNWQYSVDGGSAVSVTDAGFYTVQVTTISGLSSGSHTVVITRPSGSTGSLYFCGLTGENSTGIVVNNYSIYGAVSGAWDGTDSLVSPLWAGGSDYPAKLVIYAMGLNDAAGATSGSVFSDSFRKYLSTVRESYSTQDLVFVINHPGLYDTSNLWQEYATFYRGMSNTYGAVIIDVWRTARNSWAYWNSLGYWGNASVPGASGTDQVHLSDSGHTAIANLISPVLAS